MTSRVPPRLDADRAALDDRAAGLERDGQSIEARRASRLADLDLLEGTLAKERRTLDADRAAHDAEVARARAALDDRAAGLERDRRSIKATHASHLADLQRRREALATQERDIKQQQIPAAGSALSAAKALSPEKACDYGRKLSTTIKPAEGFLHWHHGRGWHYKV